MSLSKLRELFGLRSRSSQSFLRRGDTLDEISAGQVRAGRGLIGWSQGELADAAKLEPAVVAELEAAQRPADARTLEQIKAALEGAGVAFIAEDDGGAGVRLKRPSPPAIEAENLNASNDE